MRSPTSYGTARYRATLASIAINISAILERVYVYSGLDASARRLLYLQAHSICISISYCCYRTAALYLPSHPDSVRQHVL
jgi:hypothetical protein